MGVHWSHKYKNIGSSLELHSTYKYSNATNSQKYCYRNSISSFGVHRAHWCRNAETSGEHKNLQEHKINTRVSSASILMHWLKEEQQEH